jgi:4'-phosphopantetheinyl transferase
MRCSMKNNNIYIFWMDTSEIIEEEQLLRFPVPFRLNRKSLNTLNFRQLKQTRFSKLLLAYGLNFLEESIPESINFRTNGKPYFEDSDLKFNISHSGNLVVCGISKSRLGIDLQQIVPWRKGSEGVFLDTIEREIIPPEDYLKTWSKKEATYKGFGFEFGAKLTDFKYKLPELMVHPKGQIKLIEYNIAQDYYGFLAVEPKIENQINIFQVTVNQLIR